MKNTLILFTFLCVSLLYSKPVLLVPFSDNTRLPGRDMGTEISDYITENQDARSSVRLAGQEQIHSVQAQTKVFISSDLILSKIKERDQNYTAYLAKSFALNYALCGEINDWEIRANGTVSAKYRVYLVDLIQNKVIASPDFIEDSSVNEVLLSTTDTLDLSPNSPNFEKTAFGKVFLGIAENVELWVKKQLDTLPYLAYVEKVQNGYIEIPNGRELGIKSRDVYPVYRLVEINGKLYEKKISDIRVLRIEYFKTRAINESSNEVMPGDYIKII